MLLWRSNHSQRNSLAVTSGIDRSIQNQSPHTDDCQAWRRLRARRGGISLLRRLLALGTFHLCSLHCFQVPAQRRRQASRFAKDMGILPILSRQPPELVV